MYIVADAHRGNPAVGNTYLQQVVAACAQDGDWILAVGDMFDFFMRSWAELIVEDYLTLGAYLKLCQEWVIGNHDIDMKPLVGLGKMETAGHGISIHYPLLELKASDEKWLVVHGHLFGVLGWMFRLSDNVFIEQTRALRKMSRWLVKSRALSYASRSWLYNLSIRKALLKEAKARGATTVIFGHTHIQQIVEQEGVTLINPGALMNGEYAVWKGGRFELCDISTQRGSQRQ